MAQNAEREVAAGGVAADDDVTGVFAEVLQRVPEEFDALRELDRVGGCGGEGVGEEKDGGVFAGGVFAGGVELGDDGVKDGDVLDGGWETVSSACTPLTCLTCPV